MVDRHTREHPETTTEPPRTKPAPAPREGDELTDAYERIRGVNAAFTQNIPAEAVSSGAYDLATPRYPPQVGPSVEDVPDGSYRVAGSDWIIAIAGGKVAAFERVRPGIEYPELVEVPAQRVVL